MDVLPTISPARAISPTRSSRPACARCSSSACRRRARQRLRGRCRVAEEPLDPGEGRHRAVARRAALAARAGLQAIRLQILLDLRFHAGGQYRPGGARRWQSELGAKRVVVCPVFPEAGRTVYQGHLFVHDKLLSESGMEKHPLKPMTDPDIRRWLRLQTQGEVGHVGYSAVRRGPKAIADAHGGAGATGLLSSTRSPTSDLVGHRHAPATARRWSPAAPASRSACRTISAARACCEQASQSFNGVVGARRGARRLVFVGDARTDRGISPAIIRRWRSSVDDVMDGAHVRRRAGAVHDRRISAPSR